MDSHLSSSQIETLLNELCTDFGFCLSPEAKVHLKANPPADVERFAEAVFRAEGLDPHADTPKSLWKELHRRVARHFRDAEDDHFRQQDYHNPPSQSPEKHEKRSRTS